jgi:hypothetical protein
MVSGQPELEKKDTLIRFAIAVPLAMKIVIKGDIL